MVMVHGFFHDFCIFSKRFYCLGLLHIPLNTVKVSIIKIIFCRGCAQIVNRKVHTQQERGKQSYGYNAIQSVLRFPAFTFHGAMRAMHPLCRKLFRRTHVQNFTDNPFPSLVLFSDDIKGF
jgi:hypothetical protein